MTDFQIIEESRANQADGSPSGCSFCGSVEGPFVHVVNHPITPAGPFKENRPVQLCAPRRDPGDPNTVLRQGCAGTIAILVGYTPPEQLAQAQASIMEQTAKRAELEDQVAGLLKNQVKVVPVDELVEMLRTGQVASAA